MEISIVDRVDEALCEAFARLMPQLSPRVRVPERGELERIVGSGTTRIFRATDDAGRIVGVLSLALYEVPSGRCAWIEDVVVDRTARGCGAGRLLVEAAIGHAAAQGVGKLSLYSHPSRTAAHALYRKMGFDAVETTLFRLKN